MVMTWLEFIGLVALVGLLGTAEVRNGAVSSFINSVGGANASIIAGIGPPK